MAVFFDELVNMPVFVQQIREWFSNDFFSQQFFVAYDYFRLKNVQYSSHFSSKKSISCHGMSHHVESGQHFRYSFLPHEQ